MLHLMDSILRSQNAQDTGLYNWAGTWTRDTWNSTFSQRRRGKHGTQNPANIPVTHFAYHGKVHSQLSGTIGCFGITVRIVLG